MRALNEVFVDSAGFFAFLVQRDPVHKAAQELFAGFQRQNRPLRTTDHVVAETLTLLKVRKQPHLCRFFYDSVQKSSALQVTYSTSDEFSAAVTFFLRHADKGYSFTDCLSFVVMRERKLTEALTTDRHFVQAGFTALLASD